MGVTLHVIRRPGAGEALAALDGAAHAVLLVEDGLGEPVPAGLPCWFGASDAARAAVTPPGRPLDDGAIVELLLAAERVVAW